MLNRHSTFVLSLLLSSVSFAQKNNTDALKTEAGNYLDANYDTYKKSALQIWEYAELGYKEEKSSKELQQLLSTNGFKIETGVAGIPTAFVATYGSGKPVIGILAEYDALPGLAQKAVPEKQSIEKQKGGHGCGHHLFGVGSASAGIAVKQLIEQKKISGTIKVFGCPAEEGGGAKIYMVREGLFNETDIALHWHPGDENAVTTLSALANKSAKFRFKGLSAHAAVSPERGRSSLDAVEAMNYMVNMMREHVSQETRIHYVITDGGKAPNVVPDFAEVYYYVRHPKKDEVIQTFDRIVKAAEAGALGTETKMEYEIIGGTHDLLINYTLAQAMQANLQKVGGVAYTSQEVDFAKKIQTSFNYAPPEIKRAAQVSPISTEPKSGGGSTDVGDVSYAVPTVGLDACTWVPGTPPHSWQAVASGGTEIGTKGMMVAAKTIALTAIDLFTNPQLVEKAKSEFKQSLGNYKYKAIVGDRKPPLNYRDGL